MAIKKTETKVENKVETKAITLENKVETRETKSIDFVGQRRMKE